MLRDRRRPSLHRRSGSPPEGAARLRVNSADPHRYLVGHQPRRRTTLALRCARARRCATRHNTPQGSKRQATRNPHGRLPPHYCRGVSGNPFTRGARLNDRPTTNSNGRTSSPCLVQAVVGRPRHWTRSAARENRTATTAGTRDSAARHTKSNCSEAARSKA